MKIAILSQDGSLYSTKRLKEAGTSQGYEVKVVNYLRCYMNITSHSPTVMYQGQTLENFDAVIPRIGASRTFYGTAVVRQFEVMGVFSANESQAISR
ncbi:MAG: 30S ribosomal protein S6--L-glutamate ligase, partial [Okeania sp. SIO2D1]|nr:30S ribosomal protein S6--L-glutamate ligase [Okeania sp. SIO2D1]